MVKIIGTAVVAAAMLVVSPAFAKDKSGDMACCAKNASNQKSCANLTSLNLTADQKSKIEAWQSECMKGGCTKETRATFMKKAKTILSPDQYAELKSKCDKGSQKTQS